MARDCIINRKLWWSFHQIKDSFCLYTIKIVLGLKFSEHTPDLSPETRKFLYSSTWTSREFTREDVARPAELDRTQTKLSVISACPPKYPGKVKCEMSGPES